MKYKICSICAKKLPSTEFRTKTYKKRSGRLCTSTSTFCKTCERKLDREYRRKNKERLAGFRHQRIRRKREEIIQLLGGKCLQCGFSSDYRALQIDHANGEGYKEQGRGEQFYDRVLREIKASSKKYQLLCANCNWIKREKLKEWKPHK